MGWVDEPAASCSHPGRPEPITRNEGRTWECDSCGGRWILEVDDYGHDVKPGEASVGARWRELRLGWH